MDRVKVTYPGCTITLWDPVRGTHYNEKREPQVMFGYNHGATVANPQHLIVEDNDGIVHVVNKDIVEGHING